MQTKEERDKYGYFTVKTWGLYSSGYYPSKDFEFTGRIKYVHEEDEVLMFAEIERERDGERPDSYEIGHLWWKKTIRPERPIEKYTTWRYYEDFEWVTPKPKEVVVECNHVS